MIKIFACLFMVIDHIGAYLLNDNIYLRIIGRLSFPLFSYAVARGYYYSKEHGTLVKYFIRILILALVSEIPYYILTGNFLNICFSYLITIICLYLIDLRKIYNYVIVGLLLVLLFVFGFYSNLYEILTCFIFYFIFFKKKDKLSYSDIINLVVFDFILILCFMFTSENFLQIFAIFVLPLLFLLRKFDNKIKINKYFYYIFYPLHLIIIIILRNFL